MRETDLYAPVKSFLEGQGFEVKSEIKDCDVMGLRSGDEAPVIVELKRGFSIDLLLQGIDRLSLTDAVYVAVPRGQGRRFYNQMKDGAKLCRRLGLGLLSVRLRDGFVEAHCDPTPYQPRKNKKRAGLLLREFQRRRGDPNTGGQVGRKIVTAYRQDALDILRYLSDHGPSAPKAIKAALEIDKAPSILGKDHYGWFERVERGVYDVSVDGRAALTAYNE